MWSDQCVPRWRPPSRGSLRGRRQRLRQPDQGSTPRVARQTKRSAGGLRVTPCRVLGDHSSGRRRNQSPRPLQPVRKPITGGRHVHTTGGVSGDGASNGDAMRLTSLKNETRRPSVRLNEGPASDNSQKSGPELGVKKTVRTWTPGWLAVNLEFVGLNAEQDRYRQIDRLTAPDPIRGPLFKSKVGSPNLAPPPTFLGLPYSGGDLPGQKGVEACPCSKQCGRKLMQSTQQTGVSRRRTVAVQPRGVRGF